MGKPYASELDAFAGTFEWADRQDVRQFEHFLNRWSGDHVAVVGSGGSYSAAFVVSLFRELVHHSPTSPVTPLEFDAMLRRLAPRALLLSAEGKNRDILAAARAAQSADLASAALTLTTSNPLVEFAREHAAVRAFAYQMEWAKDGYLATNSLVATVLLAYRALFGKNDFQSCLGPLFEAGRLARRRAHFASWEGLGEARTNGLLVIFSAQAKAFAVDLESKLAEAALAPVQMADLRQFAHGRHLQLSPGMQRPCVLMVASADEMPLVEATSAHVPGDLRQWHIQLDGQREQDVAVAGLLDAMFLTEAIARDAAIDPGQPMVPDFGRAIYGLDSATILSPVLQHVSRLELAAKRKAAHGPHVRHQASEEVVSAARRYAERLTEANIKGAVCDFDGTLCRAENRFGLMAPEHVEQVSALIRQGLFFAIATGRGDSLYKVLRECFSQDLHASILVGYYSGSYFARLDEEPQLPAGHPGFAELHAWLQASVYAQHCKPLEEMAHAGQMTIRVSSAPQCARLLVAIQHWLDRKGWRGWRAFSSGHSVDVLEATASKQVVIDRFADELGIDAQSEVLRIGDSGHEGGNDYELLREGLSLSCERVSVDLDSCWNFGAPGSNQVDVTSAYLRGLVRHNDGFRLLPTALFGA